MKIVADAGVGVLMVLEGPLTAQAESHWRNWLRAGATILAPHLWLAEVTSALHKSFQAGLLADRDTALEALDTVLDLGVELAGDTPQLCRDAFEWASRLGQLAAYDGFYLALATRENAEFWSADRRLVRRARQLGVSWARWIGEENARDSPD